MSATTMNDDLISRLKALQTPERAARSEKLTKVTENGVERTSVVPLFGLGISMPNRPADRP